MESKELKVGDTMTYAIGGQTLTLKPVTLGKMKKAVDAFKKPDADTFEMMQAHLFEVLDNGSNAFATREWLADNITMPLATQIINDMRVINGLGTNNFFPDGVQPEKAPRETRDLSETGTPSA